MIDLYDLNTWIKYKWGLADPAQDEWLAVLLPDVKTAQERRAVALDHLQKSLIKAKLFREAISCDSGNMPQDVSLWLIAGNSVETNAGLEVDKDGKITVSERVSGDGKITFASCCQDGRAGGIWYPHMITPIKWKAIYPVPGGHMGIMNGSFFDAILRHILLDIRNHESQEAQKKVRP